MTDKVDVFMPLFVGDYLKDTFDLSAEEHGAYLLLLMHLWNRGGRLPEDRLASLARVPESRWEGVWVAIERFFEVNNGEISQRRLTAELDRAKERRRLGQAAGVASAEARRQRKANGTSAERQPDVQRNVNGTATEGQPNGNSSHSHSHSQTDPPEGAKAPATETKPSRVAMFMGWCRSAWQKKYGVTWTPEPGIAKQVKAFVADLTGDEFYGLVDALGEFFADTDKFLVKERHPLRLFLANANKYRSRASPVEPQRNVIRAPANWPKAPTLGILDAK